LNLEIKFIQNLNSHKKKFKFNSNSNGNRKVMAGLGLKADDFSNACQLMRFNFTVLSFNFGVLSLIVFSCTQILIYFQVLSQGLADGMVICSCLPPTTTSVVVLSKSSGGNEAAAIFNAAFGNMLGVFLSPVLILTYVGVSGSIDLPTVIFKLALRVMLPIIVGQLIRRSSEAVVDFYNTHKKKIDKAKEWCIFFNIYAMFCKTFIADGLETTLMGIMIMIALQFCVLFQILVLSWTLLTIVFSTEPKLQITGFFVCHHKTVR